MIKTKALVLKYTNMNDNDRLFTVFCPEHGKISAISKGIRSHKHKDFAALQPFCYSELVIDNSRGLGYISSAQILENFFELRSGVEKMSLAAYVADLVSNLADEIMYDDEFFRFTLNTLFMIAKAADGSKLTLNDELVRLKTIYELKVICTSGYMPQLQGCMCCGSDKSLEYFDLYGGGAVCTSCHDKGFAPESCEVTDSVLKMMSYICQADDKSVFKFSASPETIDLAGKISEEYLINKLEIVSARLEYFKNIIKA